MTGADLAPGAVDSASVFDNSLTESDLATNSVSSLEIASNAVGPTEIADNSIDGGEIVDNSVMAPDIATNAVGSSEILDSSIGIGDIANSAITGTDIADGSVTLGDLKGGESTGSITLLAGSVANGRCIHRGVAVPGAMVDEAVVFSLRATPPAGMIFYGVRVPVNGQVTMAVCNFTGGASPAIPSLGVHIVTFG